MGVEGLDRFRTHFAEYSDQYVLIGGAATFLALEEADLSPRATKDLDLVLCAEALRPAFVAAFWDFVEEGGYRHRLRSTGKPVFYRFEQPEAPGFPAMLELFSRQPEALAPDDGRRLTSIPVAQEVISLSAILLDPDYYDFLHAHTEDRDGLPVANEFALIPLKARAWLDLTRRRAGGEEVRSQDIKKHRGDVFRLYQLISPTARVAVSPAIGQDLGAFLEAMESEEDDNLLRNLGIRGATVPGITETLRSVYQLDTEPGKEGAGTSQ